VQTHQSNPKNHNSIPYKYAVTSTVIPTTDEQLPHMFYSKELQHPNHAILLARIRYVIFNINSCLFAQKKYKSYLKYTNHSVGCVRLIGLAFIQHIFFTLLFFVTKKFMLSSNVYTKKSNKPLTTSTMLKNHKNQT
jgi:hypothetical protein